MKLSDYRIGFVGFGHLAQAMCRTFTHSKIVPTSHLSFTRKDLSHNRDTEKKFGIGATSLDHLTKTSDLLLLCVRPQQMAGLAQELAQCEIKAPFAISFLAGTQLPQLQTYLPSLQLMRALPNIAASCGESMTLLSYTDEVSQEFRSLSHLLLSCLGKTLEIPETLMDVGTSMAGSSIAFVLYLIEAMARFGVTHGFTEEQSVQLTAQVFRGAAQMILTEKLNPTDLLQQIATPKGTTEAGLDLLRRTPSAHHFQEALQASANRAQQMR
jgi:pyrroline-5-carboxylate reductase